MASNPSGSSDEELDDYTATDVLLGYTSKEPTDDPFNQLGGQPVSTALNAQHANFLSNESFRDGQIRPILPQPRSQNAKSATVY